MSTLPVMPGLPPLTLRGLADDIYDDGPPCLARPELFFGPDTDEGEPEADRSKRVATARELCASCPARLACLAYALRTRPEFGVWAGHDAEAGELAYLTAAARNPVRRPLAPTATRKTAA